MTVCILLSTYNGEEYVRNLLDSVILQDYPDIRILIRDDGSTDRTCDILKEYAGEYRQIEVITGNNIGVVASFFELLRRVPKKDEFAAFCDQDDIWEKDKVSRGINILKSRVTNGAGMYCGRLKIVSESLEIISLSDIPGRGPSFQNALVENIATGCTILLNGEAMKLVLKRLPNPKNVCMHDWWVYQLISAFGVVVFDDQPRIMYRQHEMNVVGYSSCFELWWSRVTRFFGGGNRRVIRSQAKELLKTFGEFMPLRNRKILESFLAGAASRSLFYRIRYAVVADVYRQTLLDNILLRVLLIINRV